MVLLRVCIRLIWVGVEKSMAANPRREASIEHRHVKQRDYFPWFDFAANAFPLKSRIRFALGYTFLFSSSRLSLRILLFCLAAIFPFKLCFRSSLDRKINKNQSNIASQICDGATKLSCSFPFSFAFLLTAFFNRPTSSRTLPPSLISAFSHFCRSYAAFRFASGNVASFPERASSCCNAGFGLQPCVFWTCVKG